MRLLIGAVSKGRHLVGDRYHGAAWARGMVRDAGATRRIPSLANRAVREGVRVPSRMWWEIGVK